MQTVSTLKTSGLPAASVDSTMTFIKSESRLPSTPSVHYFPLRTLLLLLRTLLVAPSFFPKLHSDQKQSMTFILFFLGPSETVKNNKFPATVDCGSCMLAVIQVTSLTSTVASS